MPINNMMPPQGFNSQAVQPNMQPPSQQPTSAAPVQIIRFPDVNVGEL